MWTLSLFILIWVTVLIITVISVGKANTTASLVPHSPYTIILDGGSTGSRLHIFEFEKGEIRRKGSVRADVPLSSFAKHILTPTTTTQEEPEPHRRIDSQLLVTHLIPLFEYAASVIPPSYHARTSVLYQATAGMRLLTEDEQTILYDAMYQGLQQHPLFPFRLQRHDIATLSGELEGFYGVVAANYLQGIIDVNLQVVEESSSSSSSFPGPIGALDMGGSSTQIVFLPQQLLNNKNQCGDDDDDDDGIANNTPNNGDRQCAAPSQPPSYEKLEGKDFFATSYLSYGVDQFRERLWKHLIEEHNSGGNNSSDIISSPCNFKGYEFEYMNHRFVGSGDAKECVKEIHQLIPHPENKRPEFLGKYVGGVEHPPVRGKFFAMSLFYFSLDSLRELSGHNPLQMNWPNPSIQELYDALDGLCSRSWQDDLHDIQHDAHEYTRAEVLPHRCFEAVYMVTLLKDGFGFPADSRDITFTFLVDGSEVEWTLGMALVLRAQAEDRLYDMEHPHDTPRDIYSLAQEVISQMLTRPSAEFMDMYH